MTTLERALYGVKEPLLGLAGPPSPPRPALTAWQGADLDAYWLDGDTWRHCRTGQAWLDCGGDIVHGTACGACSCCHAQARLLP